MVPETKETIFQIIMAWRQEMDEEEQKKKKSEKKQQSSLKQKDLSTWIKAAVKKDKEGARPITEEELKYQEFKYGAEDADSLDGLAKVVKVKEVQNYKPDSKDANGVQAILINPKWRPREEFGYSSIGSQEKDTEKEGKSEEYSDSSDEENKKSSQKQAKVNIVHDISRSLLLSKALQCKSSQS